MDLRVEQLCYAWKNMDKKFVFVDEKSLDHLARELSREIPQLPDWQISGVFPKNHRVFANHIFYECAVDFCFRSLEFPHEKFEVGNFTGSKAMGKCFYRHFGENPIKPGDILRITDSLEKTKEFFQGRNLPPLLEERRTNLREVAQVLEERFRGNPLIFLEEARYQVSDFWNRSNPGIIFLLERNFPTAFGQDRKFQKRANLLVMMYQSRALCSGGMLLPLRDPENISPVIDYNIPNTLRHYGIMRYSEDLAKRIDKLEIIPKDSEEEFEIRSAAYYCAAELLRRIQNLNINFSARNWNNIELDYWLYSWPSDFNPHLTPTTDY